MMNDKVFVKESYKILKGAAVFKDGSVDEIKNVEVYSKINVDPWVEELETENEKLKTMLERQEHISHNGEMVSSNNNGYNPLKMFYEIAEKYFGSSTPQDLENAIKKQRETNVIVHKDFIEHLREENERLERELKQTEAQDQVVIDGLRKESELLNDALKDKSQVCAETEADLIERINTCTSTIWKLREENKNLKAENERLKGEVNRLEATEELLADEQVKILDERDELRKENAKLRYALARLRWEHASKVESLIDELYTIRPSSWRFYYKSKTYWFKKWQELKKKLMEK